MNSQPSNHDLSLARNLILQFITGTGRQQSNESVTAMLTRRLHRGKTSQPKSRRKKP
jgi:hypothetical protein